MSVLILDFETRSELDLPSVGAYKYAAHPSTEILCAAWERSSEAGWLPGFVDGEMAPEFWDAITKDVTRIVAHNVEFEREILKHRIHREIPIAQFTDTAALGARMSLPRKLEMLANFFQLDTGAKEAGKAAIDALSRPRKPSKGNPDKWWTPQTKPEMFDLLYARCRQDVSLTREILLKLLPLEDQEFAIWQLTMEMNQRGVLIDLGSIPAAQKILDDEARPLEQEFELLVGEKVRSPVKVAAALGLPDMRKPTVRKVLRDPATPEATKRALTIHQAISKSSVSKLGAMLDRAMEDGRVRGSFMYCGADRTARWSSVGLQLQNFKRGLGKETDVAFQALLQEGLLDFLFTYGKRPHPEPPLTPIGTISEMLRGFILGPMRVGDFSQIEARVLAWLAGDEAQVQLFANHGDPYLAMASAIYGYEVKPEEKDKRFMGKQSELGAGYGIGWRKFQAALDEIYDVQVSEEFAAQVIAAYRKRHPKITKFWERLGKGFVFVVANNSKKVKITDNLFMGNIEQGGVRYAYIELPSSRRLYYADPHIEANDRGPQVRYYGREDGAWTYIRTYGGKLAENITQATSRDVMAEAMLRLKKAGYKIIMTVHDEIVDESCQGLLSDFHRIMAEPPKWAVGLPIEVESFESLRYRK